MYNFRMYDLNWC